MGCSGDGYERRGMSFVQRSPRSDRKLSTRSGTRVDARVPFRDYYRFPQTPYCFTVQLDFCSEAIVETSEPNKSEIWARLLSVRRDKSVQDM